jgi:hypothetical protein
MNYSCRDIEIAEKEKEKKSYIKKKPGVKPIELSKYIQESEHKIANLRRAAQNEDLNKQARHRLR